MKQLTKGELFSYYFNPSQKQYIFSSAKQKLEKGIDVISTNEHISTQILQLKNMRKTAYYPMMSQVFAMSVQTDQVIPFAFDNADIPPVIPYVIFKTQYNGKTMLRTYVNLFKIGKWNVEKTEFHITPLDLYSCLESGVMSHLMLVDGKKDKVINNSTVLETSSRIYSNFFFKIIEKAKKSINSEFQQDLVLYFIAKFFLINVLEKPDGSLVDDIAYQAIKNRTTMSSIKNIEAANTIDFTSLKGFLETIGEFLDFGKLTYLDLAINWAKLYGETTIFAIEYFPYLLHFLFSGLRGSHSISSQMARRRDEYDRDASRLYSAVISILS